MVDKQTQKGHRVLEIKHVKIDHLSLNSRSRQSLQVLEHFYRGGVRGEKGSNFGLLLSLWFVKHQIVGTEQVFFNKGVFLVAHGLIQVKQKERDFVF